MSTSKFSAAILRESVHSLSRVAARVSAGAVLGAVMAMPAFAQPAAVKVTPGAEKTGVTVVLAQSKVVRAADGTEQLQDATSVKPGDVIEYTATYTNNTGKTVTGLVAHLPIPEGLEYLPKTAKPGATLVRVAAKDGVFSAEPLTHKVGNKTELVPYADYRSLRWTLGQLPVNGVTAVTARSRVQSVVSPALKTSSGAPQALPVSVVSVVGGAPR